MAMMDVQSGDSFESFTGLDANDWLNASVRTGTTLMAAEYDGGVVIAADSRTTMGSYVANRVTNKLYKITNNIYSCRSGSAADTQAISDIVSYHLGFHSIEMGEMPLVETAANIFREIIYNYRESLMAGIIVAGWDNRKGGQVYMVPLGGMIMRQKVAIGGSGSTYIYGYIDQEYKEGMTKEECINFCKRGIELAITRDGSSGGVARIGIINKDSLNEKMERRTFTGDLHPRFYEG
ncbi:unnamed protein product [Bemisia tabaci]|uniref:proteasome endopeptidase complex n=1 Tax=Bemisia tabaci TaxID=7038 RepID=A0A9P0AFF2_BEMTA|nr:PREDICTED: proteasome subunit beta type-6 [Bemisia tabaci]CAH0390654.1 unnamed protein product [Bemisia tabaci]